jgi:tetratricopeptide (TPR) repeat protein
MNSQGSISPRVGMALLLLYMISVHAVSASTAQSARFDAQQDYEAGHYRLAVDKLTRAITDYPDDAVLHFLLGQCYYQLREFTPAITSFERSIHLVESRSEYHDWLGKSYGRKAEEAMFLIAMGSARKAHNEFDIAVNLNPENFEAQRDLIRFEMYAPGIVGGGDDRALKHIKALEKIDHLEGQLALGEFLAATKRIAEADAVFEKLLKCKSDRIGVYFEVADYYGDRQDSAKLGEAIAAAKQIDSVHPSLKFYEGILLVIDGSHPTEAESRLRSYLATVPDSSDVPSHSFAHEWQGQLYQAQGRFSEAAEEYGACLALDPRNERAKEALKQVQRKRLEHSISGARNSARSGVTKMVSTEQVFLDVEL